MRRAQLSLPLRERPGRGGRRPGAGRKRAPGRWPSVPHRARLELDAHHPVLVTLRARPQLGSLRDPRAYHAIVRSFRLCPEERFRVVHFSVQTDHVHMLVEAADKHTLARGLRSVAIRSALAVNRALARRGALWADRYHARALHTPRMVRNAIVYVLANARKHLRAVAGLDPCSSAPWFDGFRDARPAPDCPCPTREAGMWLLRVGWRRHGLLSVDEAPRARQRSRPRYAKRPMRYETTS